MKITIGFSTHKGFAPLSWLIMAAEHTNFSHAYVKVRSESLDRDIIYQATGAGVHFIGTTMFSQTAEVIEEYEVEIGEEDRVRFLQWAIDNAGKPYGRLQLVGLGLMRLAKLFGFNIKNPFANGSTAYVCCELAAAALESVKLGPKFGYDDMDLNNLRDFIRIIGKKKTPQS